MRVSLPPVALALVATLVAGCPTGADTNAASGTLTLQALAVTALNDLKREESKVYLDWNEVPGASKYELNLASSSKPLQTSSERTYIDASSVKANDSYSYFVRALDASNQAKTQSETITVKVQPHVVGAPVNLKIEQQVADTDRFTTATPTLTWGSGTKATGYFVRVLDASENTVFGALTNDTSIVVGQHPLASLKWPASRFAQKGKGTKLESGKLYQFEVVALMADEDKLDKAKAVDVSDSALIIRKYQTN